MRTILAALLLTMGTACVGGDPSTDDTVDTDDGAMPCAAQVTDPVLQVDSYTFNGEDVYLYSMDCCDMFNPVHRQSDCSYVCAPDGGFAGTGDGACTDFGSSATHNGLVWEK